MKQKKHPKEKESEKTNNLSKRIKHKVRIKKNRIFNKLSKNIKYIFSSKSIFFEIFFEIILFILFIKPMFRVGTTSGILFVLTFVYVVFLEPKVIIKHPGYTIIIFAIFMIRSCVLPILFEGLTNARSNLISGITFILTWLLIYIKTMKLKKSK